MCPIQRKPGQLVKMIRATARRRSLATSTEKVYLGWIRRFIRFHGVQHPEDMGADEIRVFLDHLAVSRQVAASTQNQALNALMFLYRDVLHLDLDDLGAFIRARKPKRLPVVLSREEAQLVLGLMFSSSRRRLPSSPASTPSSGLQSRLVT